MNHTELLESLNRETILNWEDTSGRHGWTSTATVNKWVNAEIGFYGNNQESGEKNIVRLCLNSREDGCLELYLEWEITNNGILQMYGFLNGLKSAKGLLFA